MKTKNKKILSLDAGGVKGLYSLYIAASIEKDSGVNFSEHFTIFNGTSIGAVIATALAYGLKCETILLDFYKLREKSSQNQNDLMNYLFKYIDNTFGEERISLIKSKVFLPIYNFSQKKSSHFGYNSNIDHNVKIADVLKASCSDIRVTAPFKIEKINCFFVDAGFFAYDPTSYFFRTHPWLLKEKIDYLSIGSGLIENFSSDLNIGLPFDLVYDAILTEQFKETIFFFQHLTKKNINYLRISDFPIYSNTISSLDELLNLANRKLSNIDKEKLEKILS